MSAAIFFGGSSGIGTVIASRFARSGALTYVSRSDRASDLVSVIEHIGRRATAIQADSANAVAIQAVAEAVERLGALG